MTTQEASTSIVTKVGQNELPDDNNYSAFSSYTIASVLMYVEQWWWIAALIIIGVILMIFTIIQLALLLHYMQYVFYLRFL